MPTYKHGDLRAAFDDKTALLLFTGNGVVKADGALVMGAGFAKQVRDAFPSLDYELGQAIIARGCPQARDGYYYGMVLHEHWTGNRIGAFQVKRHYRYNASLQLIRGSVARLHYWCSINPTTPVHLNFPGIGLGGLDRNLVEPALVILPPQVTIWEWNGGKDA